MDVLTACAARAAAYDDIADNYDAMWNSWEARSENRRIRDAINYRHGRVLDIGCGTGLFLDLLKTHNRARMLPRKPDAYLGIDPSAKMLAKLHAKHKSAKTLLTTFEAFFTTEKFDLIIALFGTASYLSPGVLKNELGNLLAPNGRYFLMFYRAGYFPRTHKEAHVNIPFTAYNGAVHPSPARVFNNFMIVEGTLPPA